MALTVNAVLKSLLAEYQWTDGQGGLLIACMSAGMLVSSLIGNSVMERLGRNRTMTMLRAVHLRQSGAVQPVPLACDLLSPRLCSGTGLGRH